MWLFNSPDIAYGEGALSYLERLEGKRAFIVTDGFIVRLGHAGRVADILKGVGFEVSIFDKVEPNPSLETVRAGAAAMIEFQPDWIVGLGGGSAMDAAKAMWILYECPGMDPEGINPNEILHLRRKARLVAIPTTSGTGAEATWAVVLTNTAERRKLGLGSREDLPDIAIVDPCFAMGMPPRRPVAVSRPTQTAPVKPKSQYADGTYRASSRGYKSDIVVEVVIRNGRITTCRVVSQDETPAYYNRVTNIPGQIVRNQGVQGVATVTGSTRSSRAILQAADDAIQQARAAQNAESPLATP